MNKNIIPFFHIFIFCFYIAILLCVLVKFGFLDPNTFLFCVVKIFLIIGACVAILVHLSFFIGSILSMFYPSLKEKLRKIWRGIDERWELESNYLRYHKWKND